MENTYHIIALAGNAHSGKRTLLRKLAGIFPSPRLSFRNAYQYSGQNYLLIDTDAEGCPDLPSLEAIILVCGALCLEQGLHQLKELLAAEQIREESLPLILCINFWEEARKQGILIDTELLEDVLQIPVVPCCSCHRELLDDVKAAVHYSLQPAHRKEFYYHCLDFSPGRLARECLRYAEAGYLKQDSFTDPFLSCPLTAWLLLLSALFTIFRLFF